MTHINTLIDSIKHMIDSMKEGNKQLENQVKK